MNHGRNVLVSQADAVIVIGGGAGTLSEMNLAWSQNRLIIMMEGVGGKGAMYAGKTIDDRPRYPEMKDDCVWSASTPEHAIEILKSKLHLYPTTKNSDIRVRSVPAAERREEVGRKKMREKTTEIY